MKREQAVQQKFPNLVWALHNDGLIEDYPVDHYPAQSNIAGFLDDIDKTPLNESANTFLHKLEIILGNLKERLEFLKKQLGKYDTYIRNFESDSNTSESIPIKLKEESILKRKKQQIENKIKDFVIIVPNLLKGFDLYNDDHTNEATIRLTEANTRLAEAEKLSNQFDNAMVKL